MHTIRYIWSCQAIYISYIFFRSISDSRGKYVSKSITIPLAVGFIVTPKFNYSRKDKRTVTETGTITGGIPKTNYAIRIFAFTSRRYLSYGQVTWGQGDGDGVFLIRLCRKSNIREWIELTWICVEIVAGWSWGIFCWILL